MRGYAVPRMPQPVISVRDLVKTYGKVEAVRGIDLEVRSGEIFGFLGPNGAGKSTTIRVVCTLIRPTSGVAQVAGIDVLKDPSAVRARIGLVFQDPSLDGQLTGRENLDFHAYLYGLPASTRKQRIDDALSIVEPTLGLDPQTRNKIWDYLHAVRTREHITIFMTTHYMDEAEFCDRIAIIDQGKIVALGTPSELKTKVGGDVVTITTPDTAVASEEIRRVMQLEATQVDGTLLVEVPDSASFMPRLFSELSVPITAVSARRPSLDDVFLKLTGRAIRERGNTSLDTMRNMGRIWGGGRR